ncbi:MAG: LuxR C-terminal-related transcriptional regulator [Bacteroidota bacterium]
MSNGISITAKELEVLNLYSNDVPEKLIADQMNISKSTVDTHLANVRRKLNTHSSHSAVMTALRLGLINLF